MAGTKSKRRKVRAAPSPAQLRARRAFTKMAKERARAAKAKRKGNKPAGRRGVLLTNGKRSKRAKGTNPPKGYTCKCTSPTGKPAAAKPAAKRKSSGVQSVSSAGPRNVKRARKLHGAALRKSGSPLIERAKRGPLLGPSVGPVEGYYPSRGNADAAALKREMERALGEYRKLDAQWKAKRYSYTDGGTPESRKERRYLQDRLGYFGRRHMAYKLKWQRAMKRNPKRFSAKQDRQAKHIATSERKRGYSPARARGIGYGHLAKRRNSPATDAAQLNAEFLGRPGRAEYDATAAKATPLHIAELGRLQRIRTDAEIFDFNPADKYMLVADRSRRLHIVQRVPASKAERFERNKDFGEIQQIEYFAVKQHLDNAPISYFHKFEPKKPRLKSDSEGLLRIVGGTYGITELGIEG